MISCKDVVDLAFDYLRRELDPELLKRLERHLERCPSCINFVRTYARVPELSRETLKAQLPEDFKEGLRSFLRQELCPRGKADTE